jgi:hypothetical protein
MTLRRKYAAPCDLPTPERTVARRGVVAVQPQLLLSIDHTPREEAMTTDKKREALVRAYQAGEPLEEVIPVIKQMGQEGKRGEAIKLLGNLAEMHVELLGPDHRNTLMARYILYSFAEAGGFKSQAVEQFRMLLADCERSLGPDHPVTHTVRDALRFAQS